MSVIGNQFALIESVVNKLAPASQADARALLTSFARQIEQLNQSTGVSSGTSNQNAAAPPQGSIGVSGQNGAFTVTIMNPQLATPATLWIEVSYSNVKGFTSGVTTLEATTSTSMVLNLVNQSLFFRARWSYNKTVWSNYVLAGDTATSSGLVSSAATSSGGTFNQTNYGTVTSAASGATATVSIHGSGGSLTSLVATKGGSETLLPSATIVGVTPNTDSFVGWDGSKYTLHSTLAAVLTDENTPIGKVSVVGTGTPVLPAVSLVLDSNHHVIAWNVTNQGNGLTGPVTLTINTATGSGATPGAQTIQNGKLISIAPGNPGDNYQSSDTVNVSGGISPGTAGGGTSAGGNGGRMTNV